MKKLALTSICALALAGAAFAQGNVNWGGISFAYMTGVTNTGISPLFGGTGSGGVSGSTSTGADAFYYELLYTGYSGSQATITSLSSLLSWSDSGLTATNATASAGRLVPVNGSVAAQVPWNAGTTDSIVLVGWSANLGSTWSTVSNELATGTFTSVLDGQTGFFGVSATGYISPYTTSTSPGATLFGNAATTQGLPIDSPGTELYALPVPEPTTMALAGLGSLSLFLFRRRK